VMLAQPQIINQEIEKVSVVRLLKQHQDLLNPQINSSQPAVGLP
jgi:hypothetical protein